MHFLELSFELGTLLLFWIVHGKNLFTHLFHHVFHEQVESIRQIMTLMANILFSSFLTSCLVLQSPNMSFPSLEEQIFMSFKCLHYWKHISIVVYIVCKTHTLLSQLFFTFDWGHQMLWEFSYSLFISLTTFHKE